MKKLLIVVLTLTSIFFVGCSKQSMKEVPNGEADADIPSFSYKKELELFLTDDEDAEKESFTNTTEYKITNQSDAEERAENECTIKYDTVDVFYDSASDMWKVFFYTKESHGYKNTQTVYLNSDGLTCHIVYKE